MGRGCVGAGPRWGPLMPISAHRAWQVLRLVLGLQLRKAGAAEPQHIQEFAASRGGCELLWRIPVCSFFPIFIWGFVANIAYLKDLLFLSFFSCIFTYIGFICLKPYPSFLCSFCLSPLFIFYVCWNVNFWGLQYWTSSSTLVELINVGNESQQSIKDVKTFVPHSWKFFHHMCLELCFQELFLSHIFPSFESLWAGRTQRELKIPLFLRWRALRCTYRHITGVWQLVLL